MQLGGRSVTWLCMCGRGHYCNIAILQYLAIGPVCDVLQSLGSIIAGESDLFWLILLITKRHYRSDVFWFAYRKPHYRELWPILSYLQKTSLQGGLTYSHLIIENVSTGSSDQFWFIVLIENVITGSSDLFCFILLIENVGTGRSALFWFILLFETNTFIYPLY